jgi:ATP synthase protein I
LSDPDDHSTAADRLKALEARIAAAKGDDRKPHSEEHYSQANMAWRMVIELVAGLGIGFGIGYGLDALFNTTPIFMVLFIFFGLAAGVKTMMRSAQEMQNEALAKQVDKDGED